MLYLVAPSGIGAVSGGALRLWWVVAWVLVASRGVGTVSGYVLRVWRVLVAS